LLEVNGRKKKGGGATHHFEGEEAGENCQTTFEGEDYHWKALLTDGFWKMSGSGGKGPGGSREGEWLAASKPPGGEDFWHRGGKERGSLSHPKIRLSNT